VIVEAPARGGSPQARRVDAWLPRSCLARHTFAEQPQRLVSRNVLVQTCAVSTKGDELVGSVSDRVSDDVEAVMLAARVLVAVSARSVAAIEDEVTLPQLRVLVMVASRDELNLGSVAAGLGVHPSNATRAVDRLVKAGLLDRRDDPTDRRNLVLELTSAGRALVERVMNDRRAAIAHILDRMPAGRRRSLVPVLRSFAAAGGEVPDDAAWSLGWTTE
jgi:DNA-binding MarR family transcriptional regulator